MIHLALIRRHGGRRAAYPVEREALQRKDFSVVPVCGSVRPLASQRVQLAPVRMAAPSGPR